MRVDVFQWTGSGYRTASEHDVLSAGDVIVRRGLRGRIEVDEANHHAGGTVVTQLREATTPDRGEPDARQPQPPSPGLTKRGVPRWRVVVDVIAQLAEQAVADPDHPWTVHWPTSMEMAAQLGTTQVTVLKALNYLHDEGVLVKAWVPRSDGPKELWVPRKRALGFGQRPTLDQIAGEILRRGLSGEWEVLPSQRELAEHFRVSRAAIYQVMQLLVERRQAIKVRVGTQRWRWRIIQPHEVRRIDPKLTATAPRVVVVDLIRRVREGEFRYWLPDGTVHERPFLANTEIADQYGVSLDTVAKVKKDLLGLGWIVPGKHSNAHCRLAERVPPIDRTTHPAPRKPRKPPPRHKRARELADDLIARIRAGEFHHNPFPGQVELMAEYSAGRFNVIAAFELLGQEGWVEFRAAHRGQVAVLADSLPEQPDARLAIPVTDLGLASRTLNCLLRQGFATVGDLVSYTDAELLGIRNLGVTYLGEIKRKLADIGLTTEPPPWLRSSESGMAPTTTTMSTMDSDSAGPWDPVWFARQRQALGNRVRVTRRDRGWSQQDLVDRSGLRQAQVSGIECGRLNITLKTLWRVAATLEVHWADLLDDRTTDVPPMSDTSDTSVPFQQQLAAFGTRAYQARVLQRLRQQILADRTGIARTAMPEIEDGTQNVTLETVSRLAAGLGVHWADLLDDRQINPPQQRRPADLRTA